MAEIEQMAGGALDGAVVVDVEPGMRPVIVGAAVQDERQAEIGQQLDARGRAAVGECSTMASTFLLATARR